MQCLEKEYLKVKFKGTFLEFQLKCSYYLQTLLNEVGYILKINNFQKYEKQSFGSSYIRRHLCLLIFFHYIIWKMFKLFKIKIGFKHPTRVSNASEFYLRAIASPINCTLLRIIALNSTQLRAIREQLRAIRAIAIGNPKSHQQLI